MRIVIVVEGGIVADVFTDDRTTTPLTVETVYVDDFDNTFEDNEEQLAAAQKARETLRCIA